MKLEIKQFCFFEIGYLGIEDLWFLDRVYDEKKTAAKLTN